MDVAVASIVEHGLSSTTLATVSRASGLSQGMAVFYFKTKDMLLSETFRHKMAEYRLAWKEAVAAAGDDSVDQIVSMVFASLDPRLLSPDDLTFWGAFWPEASRFDSLHAVFEQFEAERQQWIRQTFERTGDLLEDTVWTPRSAAQAVETIVEGVWTRLHYSAAHMSVEEALCMVGNLLSTFFQSVARR